MQVVINDLQTGKCLCRKKYPADFITDQGMEESDGLLSCALGSIRYYESWFEGMRIIRAGSDNRTGILEIETDTPFYTMMFCMEGTLKFVIKNDTIKLLSQQCIFIHVPDRSVKCELLQTGEIVSIQLTERCYERLTNKKNIHDLTGVEPVSKIAPAMQMILRSLGECTHSALGRRIFLETGVLQLLLMLMEQQAKHEVKTTSSFLKIHDVERIRYAKSLIEQDIRTPCSLIELAHKAGLNDFKLKKGFKELFGTTVFGYLHDLRMERARKMLLEDKKTVNEVSDEVGYKNPHHFTSAFKKKYGVLPSQLNK